MSGIESVTCRRHAGSFRRVVLGSSLALGVIAAAACATIPNVRPFAAETAGLYQANGAETRAVLTQYDESIDLADRVLAQSTFRLEEAHREIVEEIKQRLEDGRDRFDDAADQFDAVLRLAVAYSEKLAELAAAGENGSAAADALAGSINEFGNLAGAGALITGPVAEILRRVADYHTRMEARRSLREAALEAQGAVEEVAAALGELQSGAQNPGAMQRLITSLASDHDELLLYEAGASITGYYREANGRRDMFYRRALLALQLNDDGISGFCRDPETAVIDPSCINLLEMEALREVEERLAALKPEFEAYQAKRAALRAWRDARRAKGALIVRAVNAWASEHRRVVDALADGTGVSAFSLRAILAEIQSMQ